GRHEQDSYPELRMLNEKLFLSPTLALAETDQSASIMGTLARENYMRSMMQLFSYDYERAELIHASEDRLDNFTDRADSFLVGLSEHVESYEESQQINMLMQTIANFERIGDCASNIEELAQRAKQEKLTFSPSARYELKTISEAVDEITEMTLDAFTHKDQNASRKIEPLEEVIDEMVLLLKDRHIERLKNGVCTISAGLIFLETLTNLEHIGDKCSNIAVLLESQHNGEIMRSHHNFLKELHKGGDTEYMSEFNRQHDNYIKPILNMQD
nr:hypothetical protein [Clostridiales bacterium]